MRKNQRFYKLYNYTITTQDTVNTLDDTSIEWGV